MPCRQAVIVDSHVHVASPDTDQYPLHPLPLAASRWWANTGHDAVRLVAALDAAGVSKAVVVQPIGAYGFDNRYVLATAAAYPERVVGVVSVDLDDPAWRAQLQRDGTAPGIVGVRLFGILPSASWVNEDAVQQAFAVLAQLRRVAILTVFGSQLPTLLPVLARYPELPVAVDHCAFPSLVGGALARDDPVFSLVSYQQVTLKVTSHLLHQVESAGGDPSLLVARLADAFGADRLAWGSDYPQTQLEGGYRAHVALAERAAGRLDVDARAAFFGTTTLRVFAREA
jgi:predicted TIM-barrel fold metal-dependent hydrolase